VEIVEELFTKIREEFGKFDEESRKVNELRLLEQEGWMLMGDLFKSN